jgi:hypothetical protein
MINQMSEGLVFFAALATGGAAGYGFGKIQEYARERYAKRQNKGSLNSGFSVIPGSLQRTAGFLLVLVLIQGVLPFLFEGNIQWIVSAGVVTGYGLTLMQQLRKRASGKSL